MRIENISSIDRSFAVRPINNQESQVSTENSVTNRSSYLKELPKNFQTKDPKSFEPVSIGELQLIEAIEKANATLKGVNTSFKFSIHETTKEIVVQVINNETQEVIREIPPQKILDMVAKMWELAGIIVDRHI
ncbi:MAG: flagellar protein FlaG [Clostridiales bacterium]|nr:flagellar protein FlaG [Clostridiales bacterium]